MADQPDRKTPPKDQELTPEEIKDLRKIQSEEGFGWTIDSEGQEGHPATPPSNERASSGSPDEPVASGAQPGQHGGSHGGTAPPQAPVSPASQSAPAASHGLQTDPEGGLGEAPGIGLNPAPDLPPSPGGSSFGPISGMPGQTRAFAPPPSAAGSAPAPTGTTPPPGGISTPPTSTGTKPPPGGTNTPTTSTGTTPPQGGTNTSSTPTGTTPHPGGTQSPGATATAARISGLDTDTATEDHNVVAGKLTAGGLLTVTDPDAGEDKFQTVSGAPGSAGYGSFSMDEHGRWTYTADNSQAVIQALKPGDSLIDRMTVHSADGTIHELRVVITGTNDTPALKAASASATEDGKTVTGQMSATDVDAGDTKSFSIGQPVDGFTMHSDGSWSFDPGHAAYQHLAAGQTQQVTIPVTVTDSAGATDTQNLVITVTGSNDGPVVSGPVDLGSGTEDKAVRISAAQLLAHATDIDTGDMLSVTGLSTSHGTITGDATHGFTFTPDPDYNGPVTLSYQVTDGHGGSVAQTASLTLAATPDAAVITGTDTGSLTEDRNVGPSSAHPLSVSGVLSVHDPDGTAWNHFQSSRFGEHAVSDPFGGSLHIGRNGWWGYEVDNTNPAIQALAAGEEGHAIYEVHAADGTAHRIDITVHGTNDAPVLSAATASATEDGKSVTGQMVATDIDHGDRQTYAAGHPVDGFTMNQDGSWSFDPSHAAYQHLAAGQTQQVNIPVTVTDHAGATDTQNLVITVTGTGDAAVIAGVDTGNVTENAAGSNMSPDYAQPGMATLGNSPLYADGKLTIADPDAGENAFDTRHGAFDYHGTYGDLTLKADGTWHYHADAGHWTGLGGYATTRGTAIDQLGDGQSLTDTITVYSKDGTAHDIVITIHGSNDRPYCSSEVQLASGTEDVARTLTLKQLLANTVDVDANDAGKLSISGLKVDHGLVRDNQDGTFTYTPEKDYNGQVHFTYDVKDAHGGVTHTGASTTLAATPDAAIITGTDTGDITEDQAVAASGDLQTGGTLSITDPDAGEAAFTPVTAGAGQYGTFTLAADGTWTYTADNSQQAIQALGAGSQPLTDTLTVTSVDGTQHSLTVTINGTNDAPVLSAATASATEDGKSVTGQMVATDIDHGDRQTYAAGHPVDGFTMNQDGSWSFDPSHAAYQHLAAGQTQQVNIPVTVTDHAGATDTQNLVITVTGTGDAAVIAGVDTGNVAENAAGSNMSPDYAQPGMATLGNSPLYADGKLTIADPDAGENAFDTRHGAFDYHGTYGDLTLKADGTWHYHADAGHWTGLGGYATTRGTAIDQLGDGQSLTDTITVYSKDGTAHDIVITIHGSNDRPYCSSEVQLASGTEDVARTLTLKQLLANTVDVDANDAGKLSISGLKVDHGSVRDNQDGTFTYTPEKDYNGQVHFTYDVKDAHGGVTHTGASTTLAATPDAAIITGTDTGDITEDKNVDHSSSHTISTSGSLTVHDPDGTAFDHFQFNRFGEHAVSDPFGGSLHIGPSGNWGYSVDNTHPAVQALAAGEVGHAIYEVHSADGTAHRIDITVHGTNDAPILSAATASATEDGKTVTGQMVATDVDHGDRQTYAAGHPVDGFTMNQDGSWSFDPSHAAYQHLAAGQTQQVTIPVTVTDQAGATDTQNLVITVKGTNDTPVVTGTKTGTITEDQGSSSGQLQTNWQNIDVLDPDGTGESHIVAIEIGGVLHQMPADFATTLQSSYGYFHTTHGTDGHDKWMYFADNSNPAIQGLKTGETLQETAFLVTADGTKVPLDVTIKGHEDSVVIDTPSALVSPIGTVVEDGKTQVSGTLQAHDADTHDTVSFAPQTTTNAYGVFSVDAAGHWTFTLDNQAAQSLANGQQQAMGFDIEAVSSDGSTATQHVQINVRGTNDAPVLSAATASATEDGKTVTGQMVATDVDHGDRQTYAAGHPVDGFTMNQDGSWSFDPSHAAYQHLAAGQTQQVTIPVTVTDQAGATDTENLVITVTGSNDGARFTGTDSASVVEDRNLTGGNLTAGGTLTVTDADTGQDSFTPVTGQQGTGGYGSFTIDAHGHWTYTADNSQHVIQALDPSSTPLTDALVVTSKDGTQHTLTVAIHGTSDAPVVKPSVATVQGVGSQHLTGTFSGGAPGGWGIDNGHGGSVNSLQGQYGTLTIDPQTGHFEYHYQQNSGVIKHGGSSVASGQHVDTFHIVQQGVAAGDADVQVQIDVQSVHGNSGHHVDHTVLQGITFTPVAPVQHDAPDDVDTDEVTLDLTDASTASEPVHDMDSTAMAIADTGAGSDDSDANTAPTPAPEGPATGGSDRLSAYFDAIGQVHDAAPTAMSPAAHLSSYLDAAGADPDLAVPVADHPDPSTLDIDGLSADVEDSSGDTAEPGQVHDVPQDIPEPLLPDPNDDNSQYG
jgi:VCBS repeat-containing protein